MALADIHESKKMGKQELIESLVQELANQPLEKVRFVYGAAYEINTLEEFERNGKPVSDDDVLAIIKTIINLLHFGSHC